MPEEYKSPEATIFKSPKSGNTEAFGITCYKYWPKLFDQAFERLVDVKLVKLSAKGLFTELSPNIRKTEVCPSSIFIYSSS